MNIKILGICTSPMENGNTRVFLDVALKAAAEMGEDVATEIVTSAGKTIKDCTHCNYCMEKQVAGKSPCSIQDDMVDIFPKLIEADGLLLATPVYNGRLSGYMANVLDRMRSIAHAKFYKGTMANKPAGALCVQWFRNSGGETTLMSILCSILGWGMVPACGIGSSKFGAIGLTSSGGAGKVIPEHKGDRLLVLKDEVACEAARAIGKRVVVLSRAMKAAGLIKKNVT